MRLMILENRRLRTTLQADHGAISIGSSATCAVHLPDPRIGAHQASLTQDEEGQWWLEVMDTAIPTCLNRAVQKGRAKLRHADEIEMGTFSVRLFLEANKSREELRRERMQALAARHGRSLPLGTVIQKFDEKIVLSKEHLEQMALLTFRLERSDNIRDLMVPLLRAMLRTFEARRAWIGVRRFDKGDFEWTLGLGGDGQPCDRPAFVENVQARCLPHTQYLCVPEVPANGVGSAMAVPVPCQRGNLAMLYVENDPKAAAYDEASLSAFSAMACCAAMSIENVLRKSAAKRKAAVATEQTIARATQDAITPKALPQWDELQIAAYRHLGSVGCRDFYDVVQLRDRTASIVVARLSVEDTALTRYFAELRAAFRAASLYSEAPHLFARALNWIVHDGIAGHAIDLACVWVVPASGNVQYCTAGAGVHMGRIHSDGTCEKIASEAMQPVGRTRSPAYAPHTLDLAHGDTLVLATDGVSTATDADGKVFGLAGLEDNLCDGLGDTPSHVLGEFAADLREFITNGDCRDDMTVLLVQRQ